MGRQFYFLQREAQNLSEKRETRGLGLLVSTWSHFQAVVYNLTEIVYHYTHDILRTVVTNVRIEFINLFTNQLS